MGLRNVCGYPHGMLRRERRDSDHECTDRRTEPAHVRSFHALIEPETDGHIGYRPPAPEPIQPIIFRFAA